MKPALGKGKTLRLCALGALSIGLVLQAAAARATTAGGTPVAWGCGSADGGQCSRPSGLTNATRVSAGFSHTLVVRADGAVADWGCGEFNDFGQCTVPGGLAGVTAVAAGFGHSLALKSDGTVVAWGCGGPTDSGQCAVPAGLSNVTGIAASTYDSLALKADGTVVAWGCNGFGAAGPCSVPSGLAGVTAVAAGTYHSLALKTDGTVVAWGCYPIDDGQCEVPAGLTGVVAIAAANSHSLALKSDGTVVAWGCGGDSGHGQCSVPGGLSNVTAVAAGAYHSVALKTDGTVVAWGCAPGWDYRQCGVPAGLAGVSAIAAGSVHSVAIAAGTTPAAPANVSASAGAAQATVSWTAPANGGSAINGYQVTRYVGGVAQGTTDVGAVTQTTIFGLTAGTTYTFKVAARNALGLGPQSPESNPVTPTVPRYLLAVGHSGGGNGNTKSNIGGIDCGAICSAEFDEGTIVTLTATPAADSVVTGWTGVCTGVTTNTCTVTMNGFLQLDAVFSLTPGGPRRLAVTRTGAAGAGSISMSSPAGTTDCTSSCSLDFTDGTVVTLTATAAVGSTFAGWSGDCVGTGTCTLTMDRFHYAAAAFALIPGTPKTLTVNRTGAGAGSVAMVYFGGLSDCFSSCSRDFPNGTQVTLAATPAAGSTFTGWSGDCTGTSACKLTMDQNHFATAVFALIAPSKSTLTVVKSGTGSGTVGSTPAGIDCGATCAGDFDRGTQVTLSATAGAGSTFAGWSGACAGTGSCTVTLDAAQTVTATFDNTQVLAPAACVVPNVKRKALATAKRLIVAAHCAVGTVTKVKSKTVAKGRVVSQNPTPGKKLRVRAKVTLTVSRGRR